MKHEQKKDIALKAVSRFYKSYDIEDIYRDTGEYLEDDFYTIDGVEVALSFGSRALLIHVGDDEQPFQFLVDVYGDRKILVQNF